MFDKEEAARTLGEYFGFEARRPDNEEKGRPDVVWIDHASNQVLGFELKTEKGSSSPYNMDDVSKGHNYIEWIKQTYTQKFLRTYIYIGPKTSVTQEATPSNEMYICQLADVATLATDFERFLHDTWGYTVSNRIAPIKRAEREQFGLAAIFRRLSQTRLDSLPVVAQKR